MKKDEVVNELHYTSKYTKTFMTEELDVPLQTVQVFFTLCIVYFLLPPILCSGVDNPLHPTRTPIFYAFSLIYDDLLYPSKSILLTKQPLCQNSHCWQSKYLPYTLTSHWWKSGYGYIIPCLHHESIKPHVLLLKGFLDYIPQCNLGMTSLCPSEIRR